jgi:putative sugar O-methyltransferase
VKTSNTDKTDYVKSCEDAIVNFDTFKRDPRYRVVLEHVDFPLSVGYLNEIKKNNPELISNFDKFRTNDLYGSPTLETYGEHGEFSPSTFRYIKVLGDLKNLYGDLTGMKIVEIGGGYGGQCKTICDLFDVSYMMVDLKESNDLARLYLSKFDIHPTFIDAHEFMEHPQDVESDLLISNYAFSECHKPIQNVYIDGLIKNATRGYITYNRNGGDELIYSVEKVTEMCKNLNIITIPEVPSTSKLGCIAVWDSDA